MRRNKLSILLVTTAFILNHSSSQATESVADQQWSQCQEHHNHQLKFADMHTINLRNLYIDLKRCEAARRQLENDLPQVVPEPAD
jgi:hypothetical protein